MTYCHVSAQIDAHQSHMDRQDAFDEAVEKKAEEIVNDMMSGDSVIDEEFARWFDEECVMWEMMQTLRAYRQERLANGKVNTDAVGHLMLPVLEKMSNAADEIAENKAKELLK